jgi:tRNA-splicing endonuclease subunit Sen2
VTSEEVTAQRRQQRKQFKLDRAKAIAAAAAEAEAAFAEGRESTNTIFIPSGATWKPGALSEEDNLVDSPSIHGQDDDAVISEEDIIDLEHLQLTLQEAFFLLWVFDCLVILDPTTVSEICAALKPQSRKAE